MKGRAAEGKHSPVGADGTCTGAFPLPASCRGPKLRRKHEVSPPPAQTLGGSLKASPRVPHQEQTAGKDGEPFPVEVPGQGVSEALVTACDQHRLPLGLQGGKRRNARVAWIRPKTAQP